MQHAKATLTGLEAGAMPGLGNGRYQRMFDPRHVHPATRIEPDVLEKLAIAMIKKDKGEAIDRLEPVDENKAIPAVYTYFGQFIDHDMTLDPTPLSVDTGSVIDALEDFRTPALDLDCVYGRGKDDQPYMYNGVKLALNAREDGAAIIVGNAGAGIGTKQDLLRIHGNAILGDKRNDENKIVSQIQSAMISLHNKISDNDAMLTRHGARLTARPPHWMPDQAAESRFRAAVTLTRWHYQYVVVHDYLHRICDPDVVKEVLNTGGVPRLLHYAAKPFKYPYMPLEFSGAAFRFGHSMVRPSYALNNKQGTNVKRSMVNGKSEPDEPRIATFNRDPDPTKNLNGFPGTLANDWGIDWNFFLEGMPPAEPPSHRDFKLPQPSYRIDALLTEPLADLPEFRTAPLEIVKNLAYRNLIRGQQLALPSGESVARALNLRPLPPDVLWTAGSRCVNEGSNDQDIKDSLVATNKSRADFLADAKGPNTYGLLHNTPLWYYILREAEYYGIKTNTADEAVVLGGQHLGPVGSRIIAETIIGLLWFDDTSYFHAPLGFTPEAEILGKDEKLTLSSLVRYALT